LYLVITPSKLRQNIYRILDRVLETGQPVEVKHKGQKVTVARAKPVSRLARLPRHPCIKGDPERLVSIDWSKEWKP